MTNNFSVVIPCHNAEDTIAESLLSVRTQSLSPVEIIVVDDGSTDESCKVIESLFPEVTLLRQQNAGAATARNVGAVASRGNFVAFLDADDVWLPYHLEALSSAALAFPDVLMVGSRAPHRTRKEGLKRVSNTRRRIKSVRRTDFFAETRRRRVAGSVNMSSVAFAGKIFREMGLRFPSVLLAEDYAFFCEVAAISDLGWVPYSTVRVRRRSSSITGRLFVDETKTDCDRIATMEHARVARRIASDPAVEFSRRRSAGRYLDDLLVRHWITVAANRHQACARLAKRTILYPWTLHAVIFRMIASLPTPLAALTAPIARTILWVLRIPTHSPFHARRSEYTVD